MKKTIAMMMVLMAAWAAFGEAYDPAKHGNPIVVTSGTADIDGLVGGQQTVIDAKGLARCATLGPNVTIRNFVLKNGKAELGGGVCGGKAVNCTIIGCQATESGAALWGCTAENCTITGNAFANDSSTAAAHGGILFGSTLTRCTVKDNTVTFGSEAPAFGGLGEKTVVNGGSFSDNTVTCERMVCYGTYFYDSTIGKTTELYWDDDPFATPGGDDDPPGGDDDPPGPTPGPTPPSIDGRLYDASQVGKFNSEVAATYNGWLEDPVTSNLLAVLQVKTTAAKPGKVRKTTIYVTPIGGKKKTYKSTIGMGDNPTDGYGIVYGALGLTGKTHGFVGVPDGALVQAAKDFTKAKDPAEKSRSARIPIGTWTIAAETASGGYDCLSVAVAKTGKATVKGTLSDGTTVSVSGYGALGADAFVVSIAYSKKSVTFSGVLWIAADRSAVLVSGSERWVDADVAELGVFGPRAWMVGFDMPDWRDYLEKTDDGYDVTPAELSVDLTAAKKFSVAKASGSVKVEKASGKTYVKPSGKKEPANLSKFKLTLTEKTGQVKGSFKLYYLNGGKLKTDSATVTGMMVGDHFYGNATVKKVGTAPIWFK